jgi:predicted HTH domain antitoxin
MTVTIPDNIAARLTAQSISFHLAIGLFVTEEMTLGQAAEIAGRPQADFLKELAKLQIPIHYGEDELAADLLAVESLLRNRQ